MKKFLPKFHLPLFVFRISLIAFFLALLTINYPLFTTPVFADQTVVDCAPGTPCSTAIDPNAVWQADAEVTFTGKLAARSQETLNWLLQNYQWAVLQKDNDVFAPLWQAVVGIVSILIVLFILAAAFLMIITRGRSITVRRFIPRFIFIVVLIALSYSLIRTIYTLTDIVQGFFINRTISGQTQTISTTNLLNVAFNYADFRGFRKIGDIYNESAVISLLLVKLTAATYYTMFIILVIRKIILWFFILVSPVFPLLLFFKPLRNTAKIWVGEMFRWVLYAPLFAIFLRGLVEIWEKYIPLKFGSLEPITDPNGIIFPTAINILLGGPKVTVAGNNSINTADTFILYVVSLLMLWMVIIMPWILLRIFLDYFNSATTGDSNLVKYLAGPNSPFSPLINRYRYPQGTPPGTPPPPPGGGAAGLAKSLPLTRFKHSPVEVQSEIAAQVQAQTQAQTQIASQIGQNVTAGVNQAFSSENLGSLMASRNAQFTNLQAGSADIQILGLANLSIPTMRDIANYETAMLSHQGPAREEVSRISEALNRIAGTSKLASPQETQRFSAIRERIIQQANKGSAVSKAVSNAVAPGGGAAIPESNAVQQVNLDDYEEIKKTWEQNYRNLEVPSGPDGQPMARKVWLEQEVAKIPQVIDLLLSGDPSEVEKGKQMVANILPFLLLGGFSKAEIVGYLKAKLEAAKKVLQEVVAQDTKKEEEETMVDVSTKQQAQNTMTMQAEAPTPEPYQSLPSDNKIPPQSPDDAQKEPNS